jgi:hypothetical protein
MEKQVKAVIDIVKFKIANGIVPTMEELCVAIPRDKRLFFNYLMDNNLNSVALAIKSLGENIGFKPTRKQVEHIIEMWIAKKDTARLQAVIKNFHFNHDAGNYTVVRELGQAIQANFNLS